MGIVSRFFNKGAIATSTRDEAFLDSYGSPPPTISPDSHGENRGLGRVGFPYPNVDASYASHAIPLIYIPLNPEIAKSYVISPTNQGQRAAIASRQSMMYDPRNSPARDQKSEGYTTPVQEFVSVNEWQTPSGLSSKGERTRQPSTKAVSPFARVPIPTRMPWDL